MFLAAKDLHMGELNHDYEFIEHALAREIFDGITRLSARGSGPEYSSRTVS